MREQAADAFAELERGVEAALETYSNVHRGSGHNSVVSTHLFEQARAIVLEYLELDRDTHVVVFCSPRAAEVLGARLEPGSYRSASSQDVGLPLGVRALAVRKGALRRAVPFQSGGGMARLVSNGWVIWAAAPDRFEAGTPAIVNIIAFAKALRLLQRFGEDVFGDATDEMLSAADILLHDELDQYSGRELLDALRQTLIGGAVRVPTAEGAQPYVNLDNAASTPTFEPIWDAVRRTWRQPPHVRQGIVQEVRTICADVLDAPSSEYDVIFTSNTTEAINLVAQSLGIESEQGTEAERGGDPVIINTLLEHNSNELPWRTIPGSTLLRLSIDAEGFVDLNELEALLREYNEGDRHGERRVKVVAVSGASNVLGTCNDLGKISEVVHRYGARLLVDGAQLVAHRTVSMERSGIDYLALSAHKAYAPFGTGVLVARKGLLGFSPAELELIRSSGEENVGGIAALGKALVLLRRVGFDVIQERERTLTERTLRGMEQIPGLTTYGINDPDSPAFTLRGGVIPFSLKGMVSHTVARELAARGGIGVRAGCHCAHLTVKRMLGIPAWAQQLQGVMLSVLRRMELPGIVRVSLGIENGEDDVDTLLRVLGDTARRHGGKTDKKAARRQMDDLAETAAKRVYAEPA
jgi:selenocysteine lyase/cysteine desulfurase